MEYSYLFLLQAVAVVFAFKTRKVKIKELNDSKSVAAIIYINSIVMVCLMVVTFASDGYIVTAEVLFSGGIMLATSVFLGLTFVPKVIIVVCTKHYM
jgi:gamma-aminobutyric acid type B receptor